MAAPVVDVVGLKAFSRDVKKLGEAGGPLDAAMRAAGRLAATPVAEAARSAIPHVTGTLAGDVRVTASRSGAAVRMGRKPVPYAGPVEFGGYPAGREYNARGRYLFPAADRLATTAGDLYSTAVGKALDDFGWTNATADPEAVRD
jgi:hypothetical protein